MKKTFVFTYLIILLACVNKQDATVSEQSSSKHISKTSIQAILDTALVQGSILIYSEKDDVFYSNDFDWSTRKFLPASTYKIPHSIIALESGVMEHDSIVIPWKGEPRAFRMWEKDLMFRDAFRFSCVPCYQGIARKIGVQRMRKYLDSIQYHTMVFDDKTIDNFWLTGASKISQFQQIEFLQNLYNAKLPISKRTEAMVQEMMVLEEEEKYTLSGKTGWNMKEDYNNGWFVGRVQTKNDVYYFASNIEPLAEFDMQNFVPIRKEITMQAFKALQFID